MSSICHVCHRERRGPRFDPKLIGLRGPILKFCSMKCMEFRMIDPTDNEKEAMAKGGEMAGQYMDWLEKTDLATFTEDEYQQIM